MGRKEDSKAALGALNRHVETVDSACFDQKGLIEETPENEAAIKALSKNRLAYPVEDAFGYQVHGKVRHLFDHVTNRHRYRRSHGRFSSILEDLDSSIHSYRHALGRNRSDYEYFLGIVQENVMDLVDTITDTVAMFHNIVSDEFSVVADIGERIKQTKRCLDEINTINNVFETLAVKKMQEWVGADLEMERLLMKKLKKHVDDSMRDLASSNRKLREMLAKLIKDQQSQKINGLIDYFYNQFSKSPSFSPSVIDIDDLPVCASLADPIPSSGYVALDSAHDIDFLQRASVTAMQKSEHVPTPKKEEIVGEVTDARNQVVEEQVHPAIEQVEFFFQAVMSGEYDSISAMDVYGTLEVEEAPEDWMMLVLNYYNAQAKTISQVATLSVSENVHQPYSGARYISDIRFNKKTKQTPAL